jgi:hypothetical protein
MHDDNSILRNPELWLAALVSCGPAVIIATLMIMSLIQRQTPRPDCANAKSFPRAGPKLSLTINPNRRRHVRRGGLSGPFQVQSEQWE